MDDLAGLDWNTSKQVSSNAAPPSQTANYFPSLKPTPPTSGRSTPVLKNLSKAPALSANSSTNQNDSFASLLPSFNNSHTTKSLSLKEQQVLLEDQRKRKAIGQSRQWNSLGIHSTSTSVSVSRNASPAPFSVQALNSNPSGQRLPVRSAIPLSQRTNHNEGASHPSQETSDILAAFNSSTPVHSSTNFPIPSRPDSRNITPAEINPTSSVKVELFDDDDDTFGLGTAATSLPGNEEPKGIAEDDDVLGLLGKPVSELPPPKPRSRGQIASTLPVDAAIAELVDMGFSVEKARVALATTESGQDIQAAVGFLLNQAHSESRNKDISGSDTAGTRKTQLEADPLAAALAQQQRTRHRQGEENSSSGLNKDTAKFAQEVGNNLFKTANSLWRAGQKKVNKAMAELNTEAESSQPKWMRGSAPLQESPIASPTAQNRQQISSPQSHQLPSQNGTMTDEAALLEIGGGRPHQARSRNSKPTILREPNEDTDMLQERPRPQHKVGRCDIQAGSRSADPNRIILPAARTKLTREINEESKAYISPARRKKAIPYPKVSESNLLLDDESASASSSRPQANQTSSSQIMQTPQSSVRPPAINSLTLNLKPLSRSVPPLEASILRSSKAHRTFGTAAFKLGNYAEAHTSYTAALRGVPTQHPLTIVLRTNRALTSLKTGDPKQCILDADQAIEIIGSSRGVNELIDLGSDESPKDMAPFWGKAMMRRAEAMEQLERWSDAAKVWKDCVEAGVGGAQSIQGKERCEKASGTVQKSTKVSSRPPTSVQKKAAKKPQTPSALDELSGKSVSNIAVSSEAVTRLRAANDAAAKLDDERFALTDAVADRIEAWKKGKEQNLRALLGSLETVLWADSGWKKVGMSELLNPSKVKINYMKGIAKVHPDKVSM